MDVLTFLNEFGLSETVISFLGGIVTALIGLAVNALRTKIKFDIEKQDRDALHSAIMTGISAALTEGPDVAIDRVKEVAVHHIKTSVPDAIGRLIPGDGVLETLVLSYYNEMVQDW